MTSIFETATTIALADGSADLSFYAQSGGVLNHLNLSSGDKKLNVIAGVESLEDITSNPGYRGVALFPFPNRLKDGTYSFEGKTYQFPVNETWSNNNLHGFLKELTPSVSTQEGNGEATVATHYVYDGGREYYPFPTEIRIHYTLKNSRELVVDFTVSNIGKTSMPMGVGWHPYFKLDLPIDNLLLKMPEVSQVVIDERMIPTGETRAYTAFANFTKIGDTKLDTCFVPAQGGIEEIGVKLWSERAQCGIEVWQDKNYGFVQLYTPPDRGSLAIEPMSCNINAFQNGDGLTTLAEGESFQGKFGVRLLTQK